MLSPTFVFFIDFFYQCLAYEYYTVYNIHMILSVFQGFIELAFFIMLKNFLLVPKIVLCFH